MTAGLKTHRRRASYADSVLAGVCLLVSIDIRLLADVRFLFGTEIFGSDVRENLWKMTGLGPSR